MRSLHAILYLAEMLIRGAEWHVQPASASKEDQDAANFLESCMNDMEVSCANSGRRALDMMKNDTYNMVFLDHMMPEMDGIETLQNMRLLTDNLNEKTPVVMLTANAVVGAKEEYMEAGFSDYLTKTIREMELLEMLLKYLPKEFICENGEIENTKDMVQSETEERVGEEGIDPMRRLEKLEGLDIQTGLSYCMNEEEFYLEMLQEYLKSDKAVKMSQFFEGEDWENYRTIVHALKSTSLTIGAVQLSEEAKALEMAAKQGDVDYIRSHHKEVLEEYIELTESLKETLKETLKGE